MACPFAERVRARIANPGSAADASLGEHVRECPDCRRDVADAIRSARGNPLSDWLSTSGEDLSGFQAEAVVVGNADALKLGPYLLTERLGAGGMGEVFRAWHTLLRRNDAVKRILPKYAGSDHTLRRFLREAEAAARLRHPNVVAVYSADRVESGYFLAMEYVPGVDLGKLARQTGQFPIGVACNYVLQAARGLQSAFEHGLVHRDIKPGNLLVTADRKAVKVADFGLARAVRVQPVEGDDLTSAGGILGTCDYMAPEQAEDASSADTRADLYSLGCTLHHLLTGSVVFPGGSAFDKLTRHTSSPPPDVRTLRPEVPADLAAILQRLLAKKPAERFQTPHELAEALAPFAVEPSDVETVPGLKLPADVPTATWKPPATVRAVETQAATQPSPNERPRTWGRLIGRIALTLLGLWVVFVVVDIGAIQLFGTNANSTFTTVGPGKPPTPPEPVANGSRPHADPVAPVATGNSPWRLARPFVSRRKDKVLALGFTKGGLLFAGHEGTLPDGADSGWAVLWDADGNLISETRPADSVPFEYTLAIDPDGQYLVTDQLRAIDIATGKALAPFAADLSKHGGKAPAERLIGLAFATHAHFAVGATQPAGGKSVGFVVEWVLPSRDVRTAYEWKSPSDVLTVATNSTGTLLAAGNKDGTVSASDMTGKHRHWTLPRDSSGPPGPVTGVAIDLDGKTVYSAHTQERVVARWDYEADRHVGSWKLSAPAYRLATSPDGRWLAAAGYGLTVWDLTANPPVPYEIVEPGLFELKALAFNTSGTRVAAGGYVKRSESAAAEGVVWVWDWKP